MITSKWVDLGSLPTFLHDRAISRALARPVPSEWCGALRAHARIKGLARISHINGASGRQISESGCAATTFSDSRSAPMATECNPELGRAELFELAPCGRARGCGEDLMAERSHRTPGRCWELRWQWPLPLRRGLLRTRRDGEPHQRMPDGPVRRPRIHPCLWPHFIIHIRSVFGRRFARLDWIYSAPQ